MSEVRPLNTEYVPHRDTFRKASYSYLITKFLLSPKRMQVLERMGLMTTSDGNIQLLKRVIEPFTYKIYGSEGSSILDQLINSRKRFDLTQLRGSGLYCDILAMFLNTFKSIKTLDEVTLSIGEKVSYTIDAHIDKAQKVRGNDEYTNIIKIHQGRTILQNLKHVHDIPHIITNVPGDIQNPLEIYCSNVLIELHAYPVTTHIWMGVSSTTCLTFTISLHNIQSISDIYMDKVVNALRTARKCQFKNSSNTSYFTIDAGNLVDGNLIVRVFRNISDMLYSVTTSMLNLHVSLLSQYSDQSQSSIISIQKGFGYDFPINLLNALLRLAIDDKMTPEEKMKSIAIGESTYSFVVKWIDKFVDDVSTTHDLNDVMYTLLLFIITFDDIYKMMSTKSMPQERLIETIKEIGQNVARVGSYEENMYRVRTLATSYMNHIKESILRNGQSRQGIVHLLSARLIKAFEVITDAQSVSKTVI